MALSTSVKNFHFGLSGAPQLTASAGSLTDLLDAVLVNGFNLKTVTSISVAAGVATCAQDGNFGKYTVLLVAGCAQALLNGQKRVLTSDAVKCTFDATGVADGTYNNAGITAKYAPLGFEIQGSDINRRWYRSTSIERNAVGLMVHDNAQTGYNAAKGVAGTFRSMAYVEQYIDFVSTSSYNALSMGAWWIKSNTSTGTAPRSWSLAGDDRGFYINILPNDSVIAGRCDYFGELASITRPNDQYASLCTGHEPAQAANSGNTISSSPGSSNSTNTGSSLFLLNGNFSDTKWLARSHSQIGNYTLCSLHGSALGVTVSGFCLSGNGGITYPSPVDNGMYLAGNVMVQESGSGVRGTMPGFYQELHVRALNGAFFTTLEDIPSAPGRVLRNMIGVATNVSAAPSVASTGEILLDVIGPWR